MLVPDDLRYSLDHQWVRVEGGQLRIGITDYAQEALGEVTMVQLAPIQSTIAAGDEMGEIEAFKAMTDLYMPVQAVVVEYNPVLADQPTLVNSDPYGQGWLCVAQAVSADEVADLLDAHGYRELIGAHDG